MSQSTTPTGPAKPKRAARGTKSEKPARSDGCPLTPHPNSQWCKTVKGKVHFFGPWHDLPGALLRWGEAKEDLLKGRPSRPDVEGAFDIDASMNLFLGWKESLVATGELSHAMGRGGVSLSVGPQPQPVTFRCLAALGPKAIDDALCANLSETPSFSFITVEGEED